MEQGAPALKQPLGGSAKKKAEARRGDPALKQPLGGSAKKKAEARQGFSAMQSWPAALMLSQALAASPADRPA